MYGDLTLCDDINKPASANSELGPASLHGSLCSDRSSLQPAACWVALMVSHWWHGRTAWHQQHWMPNSSHTANKTRVIRLKIKMIQVQLEDIKEIEIEISCLKWYEVI